MTTHDVQRISAQIWDAKLANDMTAVAGFIADNARFVHMGITFDKAGELEVFNENIFIFKAVDIAEEYVEDYGSTAIIFKKLILTIEFIVTTEDGIFFGSTIFAESNSFIRFSAYSIINDADIKNRIVIHSV